MQVKLAFTKSERYTMNKLIQAFKANPSDANRARLVKYMIKHPMALCLVSPDDQAFLAKNWILVS